MLHTIVCSTIMGGCVTYVEGHHAVPHMKDRCGAVNAIKGVLTPTNSCPTPEGGWVNKGN